MDVPAAVLSAIKYVEETKKPDIIFIEGQSSLTEKNPKKKEKKRFICSYFNWRCS